MIKVKKRKFLLLPGDGVGPEVVGEVKKIIQWFNKNKSLDFEIDEDLAGGVSYDSIFSDLSNDSAISSNPSIRHFFLNWSKSNLISLFPKIIF